MMNTKTIRIDRKNVENQRAIRAEKTRIADENLERVANRTPKYVHINGEKCTSL